MVNSRKKLLLLVLLFIFISYLIYLRIQSNEDSVLKVKFVGLSQQVEREKLKNETRVLVDVKKLVTIFTTFIYDTNLPNSDYRYIVQYNFLQSASFEIFSDTVNFIIFTNSLVFEELIASLYPNIIVLPCPHRGDFNTPMLKDLFLTAQTLNSSFFYMYTNGDDLYDSSLIQTLVSVKEAWEVGLIRQKILIVGQRYNIAIEGAVKNENSFRRYFEDAVIGLENAQEYFIVTKDSFEWLLYPEVVVGRRAYDNQLVDFGLHNEFVTIEATSTIRDIHQSEIGNEFSSFSGINNRDNNWNFKLSTRQVDHWSTTCARYKTEYDKVTNKVKLFDKKTGSLLDPSESDSFAKEHRHWIEFSKHEGRIHSDLTPSLAVVVLAYNKPDSLMRLLESLDNLGNRVVRIDLIISLDIGYLGYYDLPTLMIAKNFEWLHGRKQVVLKDKHRGQLYQWLEASSSVDSGQETRLLILEDCMVLSPHWYDYVSAVLEHNNVIALQNSVTGWSLEVPIPWQSNGNTVRKFYKEFAAKSSVVLADIKRVRSFIPNLKIWEGFIEWFRSESENISNSLLANTVAARLENRGSYTKWESGMWVTWFNYYVMQHYPDHQEIGYIVKRSGVLCDKMQVTTLKDWGKVSGGCFANQKLVSEMGIGDSDFFLLNHSILIPTNFPKYKILPSV